MGCGVFTPLAAGACNFFGVVLFMAGCYWSFDGGVTSFSGFLQCRGFSAGIERPMKNGRRDVIMWGGGEGEGNGSNKSCVTCQLRAPLTACHPHHPSGRRQQLTANHSGRQSPEGYLRRQFFNEPIRGGHFTPGAKFKIETELLFPSHFFCLFFFSLPVCS